MAARTDLQDVSDGQQGAVANGGRPARFRRWRAAVVVAVFLVAVAPFVAVRPAVAAFHAVGQIVANGPITDDDSLAVVDGDGLVIRTLTTPSERKHAFEVVALTLRNTTDTPIHVERVEPIRVTNLSGLRVKAAKTVPRLTGCFLEGPEFDPQASCGLDAEFDARTVRGLRVAAAQGGVDPAFQRATGDPVRRSNEVEIVVRMRLSDTTRGGFVEGFVVDYRVGASGTLRRVTASQAHLELCPGEFRIGPYCGA